MNNAADLSATINDLVADLDPIQHLQALDYPRRAGSDGDRRGVDYIAQTLRDNGVEPTVQEFQFAKPKVLRRLISHLVLVLWTLLGGVGSVENLAQFVGCRFRVGFQRIPCCRVDRHDHCHPPWFMPWSHP